MKRFLRILSIALLAALLSVSTLAESSFIHVMEWSVLEENGSLRISFNCSLSSIRADQVKLTLDDNEVPIDNLYKEDPSREGSSWVFMVDTASVSMTSGNEPITMLMPELIKLVKNGDNGAVIKTGASFDDMELTTQQKWLASEITKNAMSNNPSVTNMYQTINDAVAFLAESSQAKTQRNLVLISQGTTANSGDPNISVVRDAIINSGVTVYCIVFPPADQASNPNVQNFVSLAEVSHCGKVLKFAPDDYNDEAKRNSLVDTVVKTIRENDVSYYTISASPAASGISGSELTLEVKDAGGSMSLYEHYTLSQQQQQLIQDHLPVVEPEPESEPEPEPSPTPVPYPISFIPLTLQQLLIVGLCILMAIAIVVVAVVLSRRRSTGEYYGSSVPISVDPNASPAGGPPSEPGGVSASFASGQPSSVVSPIYPADNSWTVQPQPNAAYNQHSSMDASFGPNLTVTLTQVGGTQGSYSAQMRDQLLIGRDPASAQLVLPGNDLKISGSHLILRYRNGALFAEDISRNGTLLNDVRMHQPTMLHQQDVITLGSTRLRITWSMH